MINKEEVNKIIESIDIVSSFLSNAKSNKLLGEKHLSEADKKIQDILHEMEFSSLSRKEKYTLFNSLAEIRKQRRAIKNELEVLKPVTDIVNNYAKTNQILSGLSTKLKNTISIQESRIYTARSEDTSNLKICQKHYENE